MYGYVIIPRMFLENEELCKNAEHLAVYAYILSNACFLDEGYGLWEKSQIKLKRGELITSVRKISKETKVPKTNVVRILDVFKKWNVIGTKTNSRKTLISIDMMEFFNMCYGTKTGQLWDEVQEKQDEKEKRSKREKEEIKELNNKGERRNRRTGNSFDNGYVGDSFSTFDTDDFFQAALERSQKHIRKRATDKTNLSV